MSASSNTSATGGYIIDRPPASVSAEAISQAMQSMVSQLSGVPGNLVRPRWQPTPPVQPPVDATWAAVGVTLTETDMFPYIVHDPTTTLPRAAAPGVDRMARWATITVLTTFYGPLCDTCAGRLRDALFMPQNMEPLAAVNMKLLQIHDLTRVPEIINQQYVDRIDMRLEFRAQIDRVYPILDMASAEVRIMADNGPETDTVITPTWPF